MKSLTDALKAESMNWLRDIVQVGKVVTVNIEVLDFEKALKFFGTMYEEDPAVYGMKVHKWGFSDSMNGEEKRMDLLKLQAEENQYKVNEIIKMQHDDLNGVSK
jgi:hypothetical protein